MLYLILLIPYTVVSNAGEAGIVMETQKISINSLPEDIQDLLMNKKDYYNILLIENQITLEKKQVTQDRNQITKERILVLSEGTQEKDSFIKIDTESTDMRVTNNIIPAINQSFDKLIIGETKKAGLGGLIETISFYKLTPIIALSSINFLVGGLIVVFILNFLFNRMIALWNTSAIITCYSFQLFLANLIAGMNQLEVASFYRLAGLLFIPALFLSFKMKTFEEADEGKQKIRELYRYNIKILKGLIGILKIWNK